MFRKKPGSGRKNKGFVPFLTVLCMVLFSGTGLCAMADNPLKDVYETLLLPRIQNGEDWGIAYEDLSTDACFSYNGYEQLQSASVIKVFIMGAVYERICYPSNEEQAIFYSEGYEGELRDLLERMITVSDNDAANTLMAILGEGDSHKGMEVVNAFCEDHGYRRTHLGRRFLESAPADDNYTCASDCRKILSDIFHGSLVNEEASEKMLAFLKGQQRKNKIPAGLPEGYASANKTGEMPEGYGLGCIENDMAIVYPPDGDAFALVILSGNLAGRNEEAVQVIAAAAGQVARAENMSE